MVNIKETVYLWIAIVGVAAGCAFSYSASSFIFDEIEGGGADSAAAFVVAARNAADGRSPQAILADIAATEARIIALQNQIATAQAKLASLRAELANIKITVAAGYDSTVVADRASYNTFAPGGAQQSALSNDFALTVNLSNFDNATITKITLIHTDAHEGWSTSDSRENDLNAKLYPLVVDKEVQDGSKVVFRQVNTAYNQPLGSYAPIEPKKPHVFHIYGQPEKVPFTGGALYIEFANNVVIKTSIKGVVGTPQIPVAENVSITPTSSNAVLIAGNPQAGESDKGQYTIGMRVNSGQKDIYISKSPAKAFVSNGRNGVVYKVEGISGGVADNRTSALLSAQSNNVEVLPNAYKIKAGTREELRLNVILSPSTGKSGYYGVSVPSFYYATSDSVNGSDYKMATITSALLAPTLYLTAR